MNNELIGIISNEGELKGVIEDDSFNVIVQITETGATGKGLEFAWDGTQLGVRIEGETDYTYVNLKGDKGDTGDTGKSLEFNWNGTQLGVRVEGDATYQCVNLKGDKGDKGDKGEKGDTGDTGKSIEFNWDGTQLGIRQEGDANYQYVDLKGDTGDTGKSLEFNWNGTQLGVRVEGDATYQYVNLKGDKGDKGETGSIDDLTEMHVTDALGYTPMPISNGVLENYREKLVTLSGTSTTIDLSLGNVFTHTLSGNTTYTITNAVNNQAHSFTLIIAQTATARTITFPATVKWQGGEIPDMSTANKTYVLTFLTVDGGTTWLGMFGGEF